MPLLPSSHIDTFARDNLPPESEWPLFSFGLPRLQWPDRFNCVEWLLDESLGQIDPGKPAILFRDDVWSYAELLEQTNRICHVLVEDLGIVPGNRVLLRGINSPTLFALWLAVIKVGAIAVCTMPLLRSRELREIAEKAQIRLAICQDDLVGELEPLIGTSTLDRLVAYGKPVTELERLARGKSNRFAAVPTSQDDVCLLAFTSGTTGKPKATMHSTATWPQCARRSPRTCCREAPMRSLPERHLSPLPLDWVRCSYSRCIFALPPQSPKPALQRHWASPYSGSGRRMYSPPLLPTRCSRPGLLSSI